jgi:O-antigen biosynthesis protein
MPSFVQSDNTKKIENVKPIQRQLQSFPEITLINNPYKQIFGALPFGSIEFPPSKPEFKLPVPGEGLPRVIHYCADQSGCGFWRMIWPGDEMLAQNKAVIMTLYQMVLDGRFYQGIDAIRLQRQCTDAQSDFVKHLKEISAQLKQQTGKGFRIIYEVDDICAPASAIPDYNVCKSAFTDDNILRVMKEIVHNCDEMVVVSKTMKEHYQKHLEYDKISVIPNYAPRYWLDRGFDETKTMNNYRQHKRKPRILYAGSMTHFDLLNKNNQNDDFGHVVDFIIRDIMTERKYQWIFLGGAPAKLRHFIGKGVEFHDWTAIVDYPDMIKKLNANIMIAPLANNVFSRSKANIKLVEGGALGIPVVAQNIDCYNSDGWKYRFDTAPEMFKVIDGIMATNDSYKEAVRHGRDYADRFWLKDNIDEWVKLYTTPYGDERRKENVAFLANNRSQF